MRERPPLAATRRAFLAGCGALVLAFPLRGGERKPRLPGDLAVEPFLDAWIRIDAHGSVTVFTGKAELGQGLKTALAQVAAEELEVSPAAIEVIMADTARTPDEQYTAGSHSMQDSGTAVRNAAAQVRDILLASAARRWRLDLSQLAAVDGGVVAHDGRRIAYGDLVGSTPLHLEARPDSRLKPPDRFVVMGRSLPRLDIPAKVTGGAAYVQDLRLPGMVHARVVRPPSPGARLLAVESSDVASMPGVLQIVRDGDFLAVVAQGEYQAVVAMRRLARTARWQEDDRTLPPRAGLAAYLMSLPAEPALVIDQRATSAAAPAVRTFEATYTRAYQMHASIGPSCAVARLQDGLLTIWNHVQGVYPNRAAIAQMLRLRDRQVRGIHLEGSGCYGHNGADDAAADAALLARELPGVPVRVQWTREQEHAWEPYGPAMVSRVRATLDAAGRVRDWDYRLWSNPHSTRPGPAGQLLAARALDPPFVPPVPAVQITPEGSADRNAVPLYEFPGKHVVWHFLAQMPVRVSALRSLGAYMNVFAIETFMDELAAAAQSDPVAFRLRHLGDERATAVVARAAAEFGWSDSPLPRNHGRGFAFARYKNLAAYCAIACDVEVEPVTGRIRMLRAVAAVDSGEIVNPDGIRNQIEGGILQSLSWTLYESVTFDAGRIASTDWSTYPILRFDAVPDHVAVHLIARPGTSFLGTGEAAQGPAAAALVNAVAHATGRRFRDLPLGSAARAPAPGAPG